MNSNCMKEWTYIITATSPGMENEENIPKYLSCIYMMFPSILL